MFSGTNNFGSIFYLLYDFMHEIRSKPAAAQVHPPVSCISGKILGQLTKKDSFGSIFRYFPRCRSIFCQIGTYIKLIDPDFFQFYRSSRHDKAAAFSSSTSGVAGGRSKKIHIWRIQKPVQTQPASVGRISALQNITIKKTGQSIRRLIFYCLAEKLCNGGIQF